MLWEYPNNTAASIMRLTAGALKPDHPRPVTAEDI